MTSDAASLPPGYVPYEAGNPFLRWFGPILVSRDGGRLRFAMQTQEHHSNGRSVHGGVLLSLADLVLGMTVRAQTGPAATVSLNCDFVAAARIGDWIEGEATIIRRTRSLVFVRGALEHGGSVLMNASGVWKPLEDRPADSPAAES